MCSAITPTKVNRFGWNLEHSEYIVGGYPGRFQAFGAIHTVATAGEPGKILARVKISGTHWKCIENFRATISIRTANCIFTFGGGVSPPPQ